MTVVLKISKPTYDVLTTGNANLSFNSELATHSIYNIVNATITNGNSSVIVNHNLGYVPKVWIFRNENDGNDYLARIPKTDFVSSEDFDYYITSTTVVITRSGSSGSENFDVIIFTRSPNP